MASENKQRERLAIFGGKAVRQSKFPVWPIIGQEEIDAVIDVLKSCRLSTFAASKQFFLGGKKIREFEKLFAEYHGMKYAIAVNSATAGLHCAIASCGIGPGDEVITTPYTFTATATSILHANAIPVFADVDEKTFCINPAEIKEKITPRTKAIIPVHLLGNAAEMDEIMEIAQKYNLKVIEDCAQSPGTKYKGRLVGTIGDIGVFSFQETKNLATGEGGMIVTNNDGFAYGCRLVRNHGEAVEGTERTYFSNILGWNYRMTELEAAVGIEQLKKLDKMNAERKKLGDYLTGKIREIGGISPPFVRDYVDYIPHVYGMFYDKDAIRVDKSIFIKAVNAEGIPLSGGYPHPLYMNRPFQEKSAYGKGCPFNCKNYDGSVDYTKGSCPVAEDLCYNSAIWLPMVRPPATFEDMDNIVAAIKKVIDNADKLKNMKE